MIATWDYTYAHTGEVVANPGNVVTGFKLISHPNYGNRLAIKIKQGLLEPMGAIGDEGWKDPTAGEDYFLISGKNKDNPRKYVDLSFI